jgi:ubiquinol-cytochrome c reductase cytochrome b subunit
MLRAITSEMARAGHHRAGAAIVSTRAAGFLKPVVWVVARCRHHARAAAVTGQLAAPAAGRPSRCCFLNGIDAKFWGVVVMGGAVIILFFLPWLDSSPVRSIRYRPGGTSGCTACSS